MNKTFVMITATGKDKPALTTEIIGLIASVNGNIVDIEAFSMRGLFAIFMIVDCREISISLGTLKDRLMKIGNKIGLEITIELLPARHRKSGKKLVLLTTLGKDRPGIVAKITHFLSKNNAKVQATKLALKLFTDTPKILCDKLVPVSMFALSVSAIGSLYSSIIMFKNAYRTIKG